MKTSPIITVVPASIGRNLEHTIGIQPKKRVAAYARVSTDLAEQLTSYEAQVDYYTKYIQSKENWEFVEVYTDEGITATNTKKRDGFNRMIEDALSGKIDLILTKSVSRFARNTVDSLQTVRALKEKGVEIYFEKENIYTLDSKGELLITIMSSLAQEESRSISENVTWGQRKRMADGKVSLPYKRFLGYEKGEGGIPQIVESEAEVIRQIYAMFLGGRTYREIAAGLTEQGVLTPGGKEVWSVSTVRSILKNEKYAGNAILQKKFTVDFLTKKQKVNEGEVPQYIIEGSHPAIVPVSTFELVQDEIRRRATLGKKISGSGVFVGKVFCGECGGVYGNKTWNSRHSYRKSVLICNDRYKKKGEVNCRTPHLTEEQVKSLFVRAWNLIVADKSRYIAEYVAMIKSTKDIQPFDKQIAALTAECAEASALVQECIAQNAANPQDQAEYQQRYDELVARYDAAKAKLVQLAKEKQDKAAQKEKLQRFVDTLQAADTPLDDFQEQLWRETAESVTVSAKDNIALRFHSGTVIHLSV